MILHNLDPDKIKSNFGLEAINQKTLITCPHCKAAQYLAEEIFIPDVFFGKTASVVKEPLGKIVYVNYPDETKPNTVEHYICDYCDKPFIVEATVTYKTMTEAPEKDFSTPYVSLLD